MSTRIIRHLRVTTRVDVFTIRVVVADDERQYAEYQGTAPQFSTARRVGSLIQYAPGHQQQAMTHLISDCLDEIISQAGPITHTEPLPLPDGPL